MAKAEYRRTNAFDALPPAAPIGEAGHAAGTPVVPPSARPETAAELRAEIVRLFRQLQGADAFGTGGRRAGQSPAYRTLETEIRALADRYTALTGWISVSPKVPGARLPPAVW